MTIFLGFTLCFLVSAAVIRPGSLPADEISADRLSAVEKAASFIPGITLTEKAELYNTKNLHVFYYDKENAVRLYPEVPSSGELREMITGIRPNIGVEALYLYPAEGIRPDESTMARLNDMLHQVSTLGGIEYYSHSRGHMRTFFRKFYPVEKLEDPGALVGEDIPDPPPLPDPGPLNPSSSDTLYAFQEDLTFGESISEIEYRLNGQVLILAITNLTDLNYKFIRLVKPGNMQIHLSLVVIDDYILFYGNCAVKTFNLFGLAARKKESFLNRIEAMYSWFTGRFEAEFLTDN